MFDRLSLEMGEVVNCENLVFGEGKKIDLCSLFSFGWLIDLLWFDVYSMEIVRLFFF